MAIAVNPPAWGGPTREYRAAATFLIAATWMFVILLLVAGGGNITSVRLALVLLGPVILMIAMYATSVGISRRAPWAMAAMTPLLYLLVVSGVVSFVVAFTRSTIEIPIGLILAVWALRAPTESTGVPVSAAVRLFIAVTLAAGIWPVLVELLSRPGGVLIVDETALQPTLGVTCAPSSAGEPASIHVRYDWYWLRAEPWAGGDDLVQVEVTPMGTDSGLIGFSIDTMDPLAAGIRQDDISIFPPIGMTFGVDLSTTGYGPQSVGFSMIGPSDGSYVGGFVDVEATYFHASGSTGDPAFTALWQVETNVQCEW